ncbi:MAG: hypothetical protein KF894_14130 [Labilithrix sp.]|nr:hypothetical protein [Labilithrix sp.]
MTEPTDDLPADARVRLVDARRLTGPNLLSRSPLVIVELAIDDGEDRARAREAYLGELGRLRAALGLSAAVEWLERPHRGGTVVGYAASIDVMLPCAEMSEWAALSACAIAAGRAPLALEPKRADIEAMLAASRSPRLSALAGEAGRRGVPLLWDDAAVSLGLGARSACWTRDALPAADAVPWESLGRIPIALVTGTNGKTTTTRLLARMGREAGRRVGATSSDAITIGAEVIDEGDWTGPAAARVVLRRADVDLAVLETARGGILRRGLAVDDCDVALVTNISDDHVGGYGIDDLDAMARAKGVTLDALLPSGTAVLNARDPRLVELARGRPRVVFFADLEAGGPETEAARLVVERHRASGQDVVLAAGGRVVHARGETETSIADVAAIPIAFGGAARFNVENALGATGAALALGLPAEAIARALEGFNADENPRRSVLVERGGVSVVLDFGHNVEGVRAVMRLVASLRGEPPSGSLTVIAGSSGDRSDREIAGVARVIREAGADRVLVRELSDYLRGRVPGEVPAVFRRALGELGLAPDAIEVAESEVDALRRALATARPGDFIVLLVHVDEHDVRALLAGSGARLA